MSFYFSKAPVARSAKPVAGFLVGRPSKGKQAAQAQELWRLGCKACPLAATPPVTPRMVPTLAKHTEIYFLAEAPGRDEDERSGEPLTGFSGRILRDCIPRGHIRVCSFDNVCNCRPPKNRTPVWQEIEACRPRRLKWIQEAKPKLIVGLGAVPLHWMLGVADMAGMRGRLFAVKVGDHSCWFMPTYHPSFILRTARNKARPLNSMMGHCFRMDIQHAFDVVGGLTPPVIDSEREIRNGIQTFNGQDYEGLCRLLDSAKRVPVKSVDIETRGLRPYLAGAAIVSIAISFNGSNFSFALDHPDAKWTEAQKAEIKSRLKEIIKDDTIKVAHNVPFEISWLIWYLGQDIINHAAWECTQMQAHFLDERRGRAYGGDDDRRAGYQKLDLLCKQHFGVAYKSLFKLNKKDMYKSDLNEMLIYNAVDTKYTLRLFYRQRQLLADRGLLTAYREAQPRQTTVAVMQSLGVDVDQAEVNAAQTYLAAHVENIEQDIQQLEVVQQYVHDKKVFNPQSNLDVVSIFRDYLHRPEVAIQEENGTRYSADKHVLDTIQHPLAVHIVQLRNRSKLKSTYVDPFQSNSGTYIFPDGRIHTNFNTTFAETGRTSSDGPNMQNFPQRSDSWVRSQIISPKGHVLVAFDYGQLEGCTAAMCSRDKVLVKSLWEDYDIHQEWSDKASKLFPALIDRHPKLRSVIKNKLVFPAIFGARNESIAGYLDMPVEIVDKLMREFWRTFDGLKQWQDDTMRSYYDVGYVKSPTGRRHHYPLTRNQAINHPIQSFACDIVCDAMNRLSYAAVTTGRWHLHPVLNIHDDLTFVIPNKPSIIDAAIQQIYETMLTPDYPCINVPLSVTCSVGRNWFKMEEVGKFRSNKDL